MRVVWQFRLATQQRLLFVLGDLCAGFGSLMTKAHAKKQKEARNKLQGAKMTAEESRTKLGGVRSVQQTKHKQIL